MNTFNQILLDVHPEFIDLDAVDHTAMIAAKTHAAVKVLHVVEDYPEDLSEWWNVRNPMKLYEQIVSKRQRYVDNIVARLHDTGVEHVESGLRWGREVEQVTQEVVTHHQELVVTTSSRQKGWLSKIRGGCSCIASLCRHCPTSILVTRNKLSQWKRVVVALGGEPGSMHADDGLNAKLLRAGAAIASAVSSELHIVHAFSLNDGRGLSGKRLLVDLAEFTDKLRNEIKKEGDVVLDDSGLSLHQDRIHLLMGSPTTMIPEFAREHGTDLMVMGTVGRRGIPGLVVGNASEKIMNRVACSVLIVKPDDFVAPMALERETLGPQRVAA